MFPQFTNKIYFRLVVISVLFALAYIGLQNIFVVPKVKKDLHDLQSNQQIALAKSIANDIEFDLRLKVNFLEFLKSQINLDNIDHDSFFEKASEHNHLKQFFNGSVGQISVKSRKIISSYQVSPLGDLSKDAIELVIKQALKNQQNPVFIPIVGKVSQKPLIVVAIPIESIQNIQNIMYGYSYVGVNNFLSNITQLKIGESGGGLLISTDNEVFVASSKPQMILKPTPKKGINLLHDKAMAGFRGTGITKNAYGIDELSAIVSIPINDWFVVTRLPVKEAFKPTAELTSYLISVGSVLIIILTFIFLIILKIQLNPLLSTSNALKQMALTGNIRKLKTFREDEVGDLIIGFNNLADNLYLKDKELKHALDELENQNLKLESSVKERTKELEESKIHAEIERDKAQKANLVKSRFLDNMSHEFRTPMHAINSFSSLGLKKTEEEKSKGYFEKIYSSGVRLTQLLNDLLDLSKLEAKRQELNITKTNLLSTINNAVDNISNLSEEKNIEIKIQKCPEYECKYDKELIYQVLVNLLSNAIKYSPANSLVEISCDINTQNQSVSISVMDAGVGIPNTDIDHIFDSFAQSSKTISQSGGTGLGLSICKEIIELHNGKIWVESPPKSKDCGSVFYFQMPINQN